MSPTFTAFFYGTLLHPSILRRVIGHHGKDLRICPALLLEHTRHQIKFADYPGVIPYAKSQVIFVGRDLTPEERSVRGTLVCGLSEQDIELLDIFEGDEYSRETVSVHPLGSFVPLSNAENPSSTVIPITAPVLPTLSTLLPPISAQTYIFALPVSELKPELWEYDEFVRTCSWKWLGAADEEQYMEVDRRRAMNGAIVRTEIVEKSREDTHIVIEVHAVN